jgi:hypothetical protein
MNAARRYRIDTEKVEKAVVEEFTAKLTKAKNKAKVRSRTVA